MLTRVISAVVMAAIFAAAILFAPAAAFKTIILLIVAGGLYEFFRLALPPDKTYRTFGLMWGVCVAIAILFFDGAFLGTLFAGLFVAALLYMRRATTFEGVTSYIGVTLLGVIYVAATMPFWGLMRELQQGNVLLFMGIASVAMCDSFALFAGKKFGRRKFAPMTSPKKTMEGFFAGLVGSVLTAFIIRLVAWNELSLIHVVVIGTVIGFVGPMGDLVESLFKRDYHVKDSGHLIPGHGGVLDRLDALIFVGPFLYWYARFVLQL